MNQTSFFCPQCQQMRLFTQQTMSHTPHLIASIFLCGLWLPVWNILALTDNQSWHCQTCGFSDAVKYLSNPQLRAYEQARARERQQIREQTRIDRQGSTLQEHIAYLISDHKIPIALAVLCVGVIGIVTIAGVVTQRSMPARVAATPAPTPKQVSQWPESEKRAKRRFLATNLNGTGGYSVELSGPSEDTLVFTHLTFTKERAEKVINETWSSVPYERAGFRRVVFQTSSRKNATRWTYDVPSRSFSKQ